jgi:hypothetical protein
MSYVGFAALFACACSFPQNPPSGYYIYARPPHENKPEVVGSWITCVVHSLFYVFLLSVHENMCIRGFVRACLYVYIQLDMAFVSLPYSPVPLKSRSQLLQCGGISL